MSAGRMVAVALLVALLCGAAGFLDERTLHAGGASPASENSAAGKETDEGTVSVVSIPDDDSVPSGEPWSRPLGVCSEGEISDRIASVSLGVLSYPGSRLGKSGVAAAFAAHGVPFLLFDEEDSSGTTDPYVDGEHFLRGDVVERHGISLTEDRLAEMSRSIRSLYEDRLHSAHAARRFLRLFSFVTNTSRTELSASAAE